MRDARLKKKMRVTIVQRVRKRVVRKVRVNDVRCATMRCVRFQMMSADAMRTRDSCDESDSVVRVREVSTRCECKRECVRATRVTSP